MINHFDTKLARARLSATLVVSLGLSSTACSKAAPEIENQPSIQVTHQTELVAKAIGDACEASDGWTPEPVAVQQRAPGSDPVANPVPQGYVDYPQLAPGIGYCLRPSLVYPSGYFTMNCASDADCPGKSRCGDTVCRAPCTTDADCTSPTTCSPESDPTPVRYCMDSAAVQRARRRHL